MEKRITPKIDRCMGCHTCELACIEAHSRAGNLIEAARNGEKPGARLSVQYYNEKSVPIHCSHCEKAACMMVCPSGAITRKGANEPVLVDEDQCIGCLMCLTACPFGMIVLNPDGNGVLKCDMCMDRLAQGAEPACVAACPTKALLYSKEDEINKQKRQKVASCLVNAEA